MTPQERKERRRQATAHHVANALTEALASVAFDLHDPAQHQALAELRRLRAEYLKRSRAV